MRTQPLQKNRTRFRQSKEMDAQIPKATSSKASRLRAAGHGYPTDPIIPEGSPSWHTPLVSRDGPSLEKRYTEEEHGSRTETVGAPTLQSTYPPPPCPSPPPTTSSSPNLLEELCQLLISQQDSPSCRERAEVLVEAFRVASNYPPITKQSLSELDIQSIITNVRLRHDVNFDRDLSFRPNLDGERGQTKQRKTETYWTALEAELEIYARRLQRTPHAEEQGSSLWKATTNNVKLRIPIIFETVREVLKSLVPDRDHSRVDEHLDVSMLMQEIERGVCDLVRLAEWMAQLLKEHCAPMRDCWVEDMVNRTRKGVATGNLTDIVNGLRDLLGILETMKLVSYMPVCFLASLIFEQDVANHQIRNLKTLLIEDTVNFEKHYHLDRLVSRRSRVDIDAAHAWYICATWEFTEQHPGRPTDSPQIKLEIFVRAVIAQFLNRNGRHEFPETFYLDQDRLRTLKAEIEDLIHIEVCMDAFAFLLKTYGHHGPMTPSVRRHLHASLLAIMGDALGCGSHQWVMNSEALSLELLRQASNVTGRPVSYCLNDLSRTNHRLLDMFHSSFATHNPRVEQMLLEQVLSCTARNSSYTPMDLHSNLVLVAKPAPLPTSNLLHLQSNDTSLPLNTLDPETMQWQNIANRITHIVLLHWRVWDRIAYVQEDGPESSSAATSPTTSPHLEHATHPSQPSVPEQDAQLVTVMKTGEPGETGPDTHVAHETSFQ
jgi:hypothetical protein